MNPEPRDLLHETRLHDLLREIGSTLGVIAAFVALALGTSVALRWLGVEAPSSAYLQSTVSDSTTPAEPRPTLWLVDGFNMLHVVLLHGESRKSWWQSRGRERVVALARAFDAPDAEVVVVFDGSQPPSADEMGDAAGPRVIFAAPADDWLLTAVRSAPDPACVAVVTADRRLAARARHRGAQVVAPGTFAQRCRAANS
ncbi:MAG: YacP-like domain [Deltaproteobacteria bacterium]|nr:YacP-like domain [Deltaproteobacteria bacterium]